MGVFIGVRRKLLFANYNFLQGLESSFDSPRLHQTSPRLRLAGQYKVEKMPNFEEELFRRGEVCPPKSLDRHSFSGGG
jgi:hypothetical protein